MEVKQKLENIAYNIAWLRKKHSLSKKAMAAILGISIQSLDRIESGVIPPRLNIEVIYNIWDFFEINPQELITHRFEN